jgi:hypothetical protein
MSNCGHSNEACRLLTDMLTYIRCGVRLMAGPASLVRAKCHSEQQEKLDHLVKVHYKALIEQCE